jgi:serine/threonine-protein kinase
LLEVLARVSLTVAFAHQRGVLHLDLKPENIMLGHFGEVYVLDWGIARRTSDAPSEAEGAALLGTLPYMSPEQARQEPPDERSDVFALGAILFELLSAGQACPNCCVWLARTHKRVRG